MVASVRNIYLELDGGHEQSCLGRIKGGAGSFCLMMFITKSLNPYPCIRSHSLVNPMHLVGIEVSCRNTTGGTYHKYLLPRQSERLLLGRLCVDNFSTTQSLAQRDSSPLGQ